MSALTGDQGQPKLYTLADLSVRELVLLSFSNLLSKVSLPFDEQDWLFVRVGLTVLDTINACTAMGTKSVDLLDFVSFLQSEGVEVDLYYGSTTGRVKGIRFTAGGFHYAGTVLGAHLSFPQMRRSFLVYDPVRHTPESLQQCRHQGAYPTCPL